jgi:nucleotide-binding universal stress UspA family protein
MFEKVLVCLDGSAVAEQVLPYVIAIADRFGSEVYLLQVVTVPSAVAEAAAYGGERVLVEQLEQQKAEAQSYLEGVATRLRQNNIRVRIDVVEGTPGDAIVNYAHQQGVDLIAVATHARTNIGRLVFGSVAEFVLKKSGLPTFSLKPKPSEKSTAA